MKQDLHNRRKMTKTDEFWTNWTSAIGLILFLYLVAALYL